MDNDVAAITTLLSVSWWRFFKITFFAVIRIGSKKEI